MCCWDLRFETDIRFAICDLPITATGWLIANIHTHKHTHNGQWTTIHHHSSRMTFNSPWVTHLALQHQELISSSSQLSVFNIKTRTPGSTAWRLFTVALLPSVPLSAICPETYMYLCFTENTC